MPNLAQTISLQRMKAAALKKRLRSQTGQESRISQRAYSTFAARPLSDIESTDPDEKPIVNIRRSGKMNAAAYQPEGDKVARMGDLLKKMDFTRKYTGTAGEVHQRMVDEKRIVVKTSGKGWLVRIKRGRGWEQQAGKNARDLKAYLAARKEGL